MPHTIARRLRGCGVRMCLQRRSAVTTVQRHSAHTPASKASQGTCVCANTYTQNQASALVLGQGCAQPGQPRMHLSTRQQRNQGTTRRQPKSKQAILVSTTPAQCIQTTCCHEWWQRLWSRAQTASTPMKGRCGVRTVTTERAGNTRRNTRTQHSSRHARR